MKIGIIKETKKPIDNRVALIPEQIADLNKRFPKHEIVVQSSDIRAYSDEEYRKVGVRVVDDLSDCDVLFGIKEANVNTLIPNKHYMFFGHIAKMQQYNLPLIQSLMKMSITFSDYEYLVDDKGKRVCAFGWWAGIVGVYYTLRAYGLKNKSYTLPKPNLNFTLDDLIGSLKNIKLPSVKVLVTGAGRVSQGAQYILNTIGAIQMSEFDYLNTKKVDRLSYTVADVNLLVKRKDGGFFMFDDFVINPDKYDSDFMRWAYETDVLICANYWDSKAPVYLNQDNLRDDNLRIKLIGDITCDIMGGIKSTIRSSTHTDPYYDYNPWTEKEEPSFSSDNNITVMAVDTCPNALAIDTSKYFGEMLIKHVFEPLLSGKTSDVIERATIIRNGELTDRYKYLSDFANGKL